MDKEKMKKDMGRILDEAQEKTEVFKDALEEKYETFKEKSKEKRLKADQYISDNPERSVLISLGIGFIVGLGLASLISGKCRDCRK